jgi:hypothetical protein
VRGRVEFRIGRIVYLSFSRDGCTMGFAFPKEWRRALVESEPERFSLPSESDMRYHWFTYVSPRLTWMRCATLSRTRGPSACPSGSPTNTRERRARAVPFHDRFERRRPASLRTPRLPNSRPVAPFGGQPVWFSDRNRTRQLGIRGSATTLAVRASAASVSAYRSGSRHAEGVNSPSLTDMTDEIEILVGAELYALTRHDVGWLIDRLRERYTDGLTQTGNAPSRLPGRSRSFSKAVRKSRSSSASARSTRC